MNPKYPRLSLVLLAGVCAYGLGWFFGQGVEALRRRPTEFGPPQGLGFAETGAASNEGSASNPPPGEGVVSAFLPTGQTALQVLTNRLAELDRSAREYHSVLLDQLTPLFLSLTPESFPRVWSQALALQSPALRKDLLQTLAHAWAGKDPTAALVAVQNLPANSERQQAIETVLWRWAKTQPAAARAWAAQQPAGERRETALRAVISAMVQTDAAGAAALLSELPPGARLNGALRQVIDALAVKNPAAAAALLDKVSPSQRSSFVSTIAAGFAAQGVEVALQWARSLPSPDLRQEAMGGLVYELAKTDPAQAQQIAADASDPGLRRRLTGKVALAFAKTDLATTLAWLGQIPDPSDRQQAAEHILRGEMNREPQTAGQLALTLFPEGDSRNRALANLGRKWLGLSQDDQTARQLAEQLPAGAERDAFLSGLCHRLQASSPEATARLVAAMSAGPTQADAAKDLARHWAMTAPEPAAHWVAGLSDGPARLQCLPEVAGAWAEWDATAVSDWLRTLPADRAQAKAIETFIARSAQPQAASAWVESIENEAKRYQAIEKIAHQWLPLDAETARTWLQQTSLPADRKEKLLNHP